MVILLENNSKVNEMSRNKRILISVILLVLMCASALITLSACSLTDLGSGIHVHSNGVYYTVYPFKFYATVHGFDQTDDAAQIYAIPSHVRYLGAKYAVTKFDIPSNLDGIDSDWYRIVHGGGYAKELVVPKTVESISLREPIGLSDSNYDFKNLTSITVDAENEHYKSVDGVLYTADGSGMLFYPPAKSNAYFTMPKEVTHIYSTAKFDKIEAIREFYVESGSQTYRAINGAIYTFDGSKLLYYPRGKHTDTFVIPKEMTYFDCNFFRNNKYIKYFQAEEGNSVYSAIDGNVYSADGGILLFRKSSDDNVALALPQSVKIVYGDALSGVKYLYIPSSLEKVVFEVGSFYGEINSKNPLGKVQYVFFESDTLPDYARYVQFKSAYLGVTREQFRLAVDGDFGQLQPLNL